MGAGCCVLTGGLGEEDWRGWTQHPCRKDWEIIMDLGEGAFSQARAPAPPAPGVSVRRSGRALARIEDGEDSRPAGCCPPARSRLSARGT
jgi:hypothetical protein